MTFLKKSASVGKPNRISCVSAYGGLYSNLTTDSFKRKAADEAFLDENFKCRTCKRTAGAHSAPAPGN